MQSLRQQISRKRLIRNFVAMALPASLGVAMGIAGFLALDIVARPANSAPLATANQQPAQRASEAYRNCATARAAGDSPLYAGQPGYGAHLDRDADGIACEPSHR